MRPAAPLPHRVPRTPTRRRAAAVLSAVLSGLALVGFGPGAPAGAADFPRQPIQIVVPFTPGGNTDLLARILGEKLQAKFGETVTVVNRPGGGTNIGAAAVASARPDGYTLLIGPPASYVVNQFIYPSMPFNQDTAFEPISLIAKFPNVMVTAPSTGITSIQDLITKAKADPGKLNYASAGIGAASHLSGALFNQMAGIDTVHVPYKGTSQSLQDLVAGRVSYTIDNLGPIYPFIQSGQLIALGVSTKEPVGIIPKVPPIATVLPGYELSSWNVLAAPAGTPKEIVALLSRECAAILKMPDVAEKMRAFGSEPVGGTPAETAAFLKSERTRWEAAVKAARIKPEDFK
ncbi:tripartite tricarboxylate transporter substrate binding protein [Rhodoplanes sp. TEM]|uniref:Tripartite tricarboxylate transporter substrate binding protein n=1 Tax=Rhodoplanes tepidamans TaxID=200616 RepID=A0ABT5JC05_RHOTP|nr:MULTISPECIES: tripartite tricarboxylate transporter substrate binding protein [Rhodoplanes]MDC7787152.1 tripartite tricarboxylate transporter substrate binding protein [Rhodoplanes tepidamans]MDC7984284.1 tripartite tricarboxylate transporter substrate binding protein [Rhodoplanes sp. TEM]MDQ0356081.1 tripartite-type tricarboxylate transporter receptor subunit TctC [Rhodoplanes tepidamans]